MSSLSISYAAATFLSALMAGFLFAFTIIVMPGIKHLDDRDFLRAFQAIDRVIQNNQPLFMLMWLGSTVALAVAAVLAVMHQTGLDRALVVAAAAASIVGIQLPTMTINIPLNNRLQSLELDALDETTLQQERTAFEPRWNRWNVRRTWVSVAILVALLTALVRLSS